MFLVDTICNWGLMITVYSLAFHIQNPISNTLLSLKQGRTVCAVFASCVTLREVIQMFMTRQQELQEVRHMVRNEAGLNWFEKACRYLVLGFTLIVIAVVGLPAWIFHGRSRNMWAGILNDNLNDDGWIQQFVVKYIMYDPLTFLGMPKATTTTTTTTTLPSCNNFRTDGGAAFLRS